MNANAGRKAFVVNRVGDLAIILAMTLLFWTFGSLDFNTVFTSAAELFIIAIRSIWCSLGCLARRLGGC
ncbi:MAG: hypothetical protein H6669_13100 [Ardenticatenaceae bacterium]|nr:hypothetical protein [Ardenticatenaceae bacterium]